MSNLKDIIKEICGDETSAVDFIRRDMTNGDVNAYAWMFRPKDGAGTFSGWDPGHVALVPKDDFGRYDRDAGEWVLEVTPSNRRKVEKVKVLTANGSNTWLPVSKVEFFMDENGMQAVRDSDGIEYLCQPSRDGVIPFIDMKVERTLEVVASELEPVMVSETPVRTKKDPTLNAGIDPKARREAEKAKKVLNSAAGSYFAVELQVIDGGPRWAVVRSWRGADKAPVAHFPATGEGRGQAQECKNEHDKRRAADIAAGLNE